MADPNGNNLELKTPVGSLSAKGRWTVVVTVLGIVIFSASFVTAIQTAEHKRLERMFSRLLCVTMIKDPETLIDLRLSRQAFSWERLCPFIESDQPELSFFERILGRTK
jgi:hypothetical protein